MRNPISKETLQNLKFAFDAAKEKMGGNGQKLAFAAFSVLLGFVLMAILAPFAYRLPGIFQAILSLIPFGLLVFGVGVAVRLLFQFAKDEKDGAMPERQTRGTIAKTAIIAALDEVENAALIKKDFREYDDCLSGKFENLPVAIIRSGRYIYGVIRTKEAFKTIVLLSEIGKIWPYGLPIDKKLTPITLPLELGAEGWAIDNLKERDLAQEIAFQFNTALKTAAIGGGLPYFVAKGRNLVLAWDNGDIGSCALITYEFAKCLKAQ